MATEWYKYNEDADDLEDNCQDSRRILSSMV